MSENIAGKPQKLSLGIKLIYGSGDWSRASYNTIKQFFYWIFLTDVVRLNPLWASFSFVIATIWDAINDPVIGSLSDNVRTKWGRRRPFLLIFAVPFMLAFMLLWWAPPWQSQVMLAIHVTLAFMVSDSIQTLVTVPHQSLTPEIASDYDERTSLTTFRMIFNLIASLVTAVAAPDIVKMVVRSTVAAGGTETLGLQQGYITVAAIFGGLAIIPYLLNFFFIRERPISHEVPREQPKFGEILKLLWKNTPFRYATGIYVLNWVSTDIVAGMLPYFLLYWVTSGDLLYKVPLIGMGIESVGLGIMMLTAVLALPLWNWISRKLSKRAAYIIGISFWIAVQLFVFFIQPGQVGMVLVLAFLAGIAISNAHVIPEAMFPDVIDWDEVKTNARHEGLYYGAVSFIRKLSTAIAGFLSLQMLNAFGYQKPIEGSASYMPPQKAVLAIRILTGPFVAILLVAALVVASLYPLTRDRQHRMRAVLERRARKAERREKRRQARTG